jgi:hypothetical protein
MMNHDPDDNHLNNHPGLLVLCLIILLTACGAPAGSTRQTELSELISVPVEQVKSKQVT